MTNLPPIPPLTMHNAERRTGPTPTAAPTPINADAHGGNPLRPRTLNDMIGQGNLRSLLRRIIDASKSRHEPMDHMLLVGGSGTGKSTIATVVGNELGADVYQVEAPVSHDLLLALREVMADGDVLFIDEVHQQAIMERRGRQSSTQPEVLFNVMEDRTLVSGSGVLPFPAITVIAATTDEGMLPDPFVNRFPLRPVIEPYSWDDMLDLVYANVTTLGGTVEIEAARMFGDASRKVPRVVNNYVKNAMALVPEDKGIRTALAEEVLFSLNGVTTDGLTRDMQNVLTFLYARARRITGWNEVVYQASVSTIATAIGKSRDQKAVQLRIEPYLIERGFLQVGHGGRRLTDAGVRRAQELLTSSQEVR